MIAEPQPRHKFKWYGAAAELLYDHKGPNGDPLEEYDEVLFEGVAGGGKSLAIAMFIHTRCLKYPGMQWLMVRKYRDSMSESCMKTLEDEILKIHMPQICDGRDRTQRGHYEYPEAFNKYSGRVAKSRIVLCGITDEEKIRSTAWGIIWINEATEISREHYETLMSRSRPQGAKQSPYNIVISDCNPAHQGHHLNVRFKPDPNSELKRLRLITHHHDNPTYWNHDTNEWTEDGRRYMAKLKGNTGARYLRLYKGEWSSEEGQVYNEFERHHHVIRRKDLPVMEYHFGSVDWGFRNAGVIQIWGVDKNGAMYLVHETYRAQQTIDFWAEEALRLYLEFRPVAYVCDPAAPDKREQFNARLCRAKGGKIGRIALEANNDREAGMQEVKSALLREHHNSKCDRDCLRPDRHGPAKMYFVEDSLRHGVCPVLSQEKGHSICTVDEIDNLIWLKAQDGKPVKEMWDDSIPHDGCDAMRYAAMFNFKRGVKRNRNSNPWPAGTMGHRLWKDGIHLPQVG